MQASAYEIEARVEQDHWWFVGRRALFADLLRRLPADRSLPALDAGSGTGANIRLLSQLGFSECLGLDRNQGALTYCKTKGPFKLMRGDITSIPLRDQSVALVMATDIIEHVDQPEKALKEIFRVTRPGGRVLFTVPAFESLWGLQDEVSHHKRRYRMGPFLNELRNSGFEIQEHFHFNYLLFLPIFLARQAMRFLKTGMESENQLNSPWLNRILTTIFLLDIKSAKTLRPPFGVSILVIAARPSP